MKPKIFNAFGKDLLTKIGPYKVGESVSIKCEVKGGRPRPNVTWLKNYMIVDENFELSSETTSTNILTIPSIKRIDQGSIFTCEAKNNNSTLPLTTSVIMDMTCKSVGQYSFSIYLFFLQLAQKASPFQEPQSHLWLGRNTPSNVKLWGPIQIQTYLGRLGGWKWMLSTLNLR